MRAFILFLLLANAVFFAFSQGLFSDNQDETTRFSDQVKQDELRILTTEEIKAPLESSEAPPVEKARKEMLCLLYPSVPNTKIDRIEALKAERFSDLSLTKEPLSNQITFWVHIPPLANKELAEKKFSEVAKLGFKDSFIVKDGKDQWAISFGVFKTQEAADRFLSSLKEKQVRSAIVKERKDKPIATRLVFQGDLEKMNTLEQSLLTILPNDKAEKCPTVEKVS